MLKNNQYYYVDEYMYFTFNNIHSSQYNLVIQNDVEDLVIYADQEAKLDLIQPQYKTGQYKLGTTNPQRTIPLKIVAEKATRADIKQILKWLEIGSVGCLSFDYAPDWAYDVAISSIKNPNIYPQDADTFIISTTVTFVTLEQTTAHNKINGTVTISSSDEIGQINYALINNSLCIPPIAIRKDTRHSNLFQCAVHFIGNCIATISTRAYNEDPPVSGTQLSFVLDVAEIGELQHNEATIISNTEDASLTLAYDSSSNLFFIDGQVAEYAVLKDKIENTSLFKHNICGLFLNSPGAPILINSYDVDELSELISTGEHWFIYKCTPPLHINIEASPSIGDVFGDMYYDNDLREDTIVETAQIIRNMIESNNSANFYFGFYKTFTIATNYENIMLNICEYTNVL